MTEIRERVYLGRDNTIDLELREDGLAVDITGLTRARLELFSDADPDGAALVVDSAVVPGAFDWLTGGAAGLLHLSLGDVLSVGTFNVRLVVYDAGNLNGLIWTHEKGSGCAGDLFVVDAVAAEDAA